MEREDGGRARILQRPLLDHEARAAAALLARLEEEAHGAGEAPGFRGQHYGGTQQTGYMPVMAAGVGHAGIGRGVRLTALVLHRQRIHVGPQGDAGARLVRRQCGDNAGFPHPRADVHAGQPPQPFGHAFRRAVLLEGGFGVGMQVTPEGDQFRQQFLEARFGKIL